MVFHGQSRRSMVDLRRPWLVMIRCGWSEPSVAGFEGPKLILYSKMKSWKIINIFRYEIASAKTNPEKFLESIRREKDEMLDDHFSDKSFYEKKIGARPYSTSKIENGAKLFGVLFWCWRTYVHLTNFWRIMMIFFRKHENPLGSTF